MEGLRGLSLFTGVVKRSRRIGAVPGLKRWGNQIMNTDSFKYIALDVAKSFVSVKGARALNLAEKLNFGGNIVLKSLSNGTIYAVCNDVINYFTNSNSKLLKGNILGFSDDIGIDIAGTTRYGLYYRVNDNEASRRQKIANKVFFSSDGVHFEYLPFDDIDLIRFGPKHSVYVTRKSSQSIWMRKSA